METFERQILRSLQKHGVLSKTGLYRYFHRYRAYRKNLTVQKLVDQGLVHKEVKRSNEHARKPTELFRLTKLGEETAKNISMSLDDEN